MAYTKPQVIAQNTSAWCVFRHPSHFPVFAAKPCYNKHLFGNLEPEKNAVRWRDFRARKGF